MRKSDLVLVFVCLVLGAAGAILSPQQSDPQVMLAGADWVYYIIYIGISLLASYLLRPKSKSPVNNDKPTTLTTRGSYTPWFIGIRLVAPVFAWAGGREGRKEKVSGGGKGLGGSSEQKVWYETGWHILGIGPLHALYSIIEGGKIIFKGPITSVSHPSGSSIELRNGQAFTIYWGEPDQPVNTFFGASSRLGISSRWPGVAYIQWHKKRLGTSPNWNILEYVLERRASGAFLTQSEPTYEQTPVLLGATFPIIGVNADADPDVGFLLIDGSHAKKFDPGLPISLSGTGLPDGDYVVRRAIPVIFGLPVPPNGNPLNAVETQIYLEGGTLGATATGSAQLYEFADNAGANIAHAIADMLFDEFPRGIALDPAGQEPWDLESLEALGVEAENESWLASITSVDGDTVSSILANALQDHGTMLPFDIDTGAMLFNRCREPSGTLPNISSDHQSGSLPEIETKLGEFHSDEMIFSFADLSHGFADMTIGIAEDGHVSYMQHARPRIIPISSTVHFGTAAQLAETRAQEELAGSGHIKLRCNRDCRHLIPGQAVVAFGFDEVLRVLTVGFDELSEEVVLEVMPDFYGAPKSDFVNEQGGGQVTILDPEPNLQTLFLEIPEQLLSTEQMFIIVPSIRATDQVVSSSLFLSRDDTTYTYIGDEDSYVTGGLSDVDLDATGKTYLDQGPTFTLRGPDIALAEDLSSDPVNFGLGRQLCAIYSSNGLELCYVEKITVVSGSQCRLDGLLRARFDTRKIDHPTGAEVYVFGNDSLLTFDDILLQPEELLYLKSVPNTSGGSLLLSDVAPIGAYLRGKGLRPIDPEGFRCTAPFLNSPAYRTGDDVTVKWNWSSALSSNTGAGFQNYGAVIGPEVIKGAFIVELLTPADVVVQTDTVTVASITYPTATLAASPISNGNFKVRVKQSYNGYFSEEVTFTVNHI